MKTFNTAVAGAVAVTFLSIALPSHASEIGWFDCAAIGLTDNLTGWVCENEDPYNTPSYGSLDVYINGGPGVGYHYANFTLDSGTWQKYYPAVNGAGYCGSDPYVGFSLVGWFTEPGVTQPDDIYIYWRDSNNVLHEMGGSPKRIGTSAGTYC